MSDFCALGRALVAFDFYYCAINKNCSAQKVEIIFTLFAIKRAPKCIKIRSRRFS